MLVPPVEAGAVHDNATCPLPATATRLVGAIASPAADALTLDVKAPKPPVVTAATRNVCTAPAVRLPTVYAVAVVPVFATTVVHDVPPLVLRSTR